MNVVLLASGASCLPKGDVRARHVLEVLRRGVGDTFDAGVVNGPLGKATVTAVDGAGVHFDFVAVREPPPLPNITLIVGLPRPATAKDILRDATTLGVGTLRFVASERTTSSYATSHVWSEPELHAQLLLGAAQAFDTRLPTVTSTGSLAEALSLAERGECLALDNYEAGGHLGGWVPAGVGPVSVAIGPERGWGPRDREVLRAAGATLYHLGPRVLRVEMAVVAALTLIHARR